VGYGQREREEGEKSQKRGKAGKVLIQIHILMENQVSKSFAKSPSFFQ
jgi:hypothetical protein